MSRAYTCMRGGACVCSTAAADNCEWAARTRALLLCVAIANLRALAARFYGLPAAAARVSRRAPALRQDAHARAGGGGARPRARAGSDTRVRVRS